MLKRILGLIIIACTLTGCTTLMVDESFKALPAQERSIVSPNVDWVATSDAIQICEALSKHSKGAILKTDHGCSVWSKAAKQCTIFTLNETYHSVLGHEFRHCVEGHFHSPPAQAPPLICK